MFQKILVPLDGSELAEIALEPALCLAEMVHGEVILLRVAVPDEALAPLAVSFPLGSSMSRPAVRGAPQDLDLAEEYLGRLRLGYARAGVQLHTEVAAGAPPQQIVAIAEAHHVDLIVMSTHGRSGIGRLIYGSVAEAVLRGTHLPLMIVPSPLRDSR